MAEPDRNLLFLNPHDRRRYCANPFSHHHHNNGAHPNALTSRPASSRDLVNALNANSTDLLDYLGTTLEYTPEQVQAVGHTLGLTETELATLQEAEDEKRMDAQTAYRRVRVAAATMEAVIHNRAAVNTPAILQASEKELREWHEFTYPAAIEETLLTLEKIEAKIDTGNFSTNAAWALAEAQLRRRCGFAWEVASRLGIDAFSGYVKGVDLSVLDDVNAV